MYMVVNIRDTASVVLKLCLCIGKERRLEDFLYDPDKGGDVALLCVAHITLCFLLCVMVTSLVHFATTWFCYQEHLSCKCKMSLETLEAQRSFLGRPFTKQLFLQLLLR